MNKRPVIGMVIGDNPKLLERRLIINTAYIRAIEESGGLVLLIPVSPYVQDADQYAQVIDGLLLPGGPDVSPKNYGESPHPSVTYTFEMQDALEMQLIHRMIEQGKPILGICRGLQLLNVALGGNLYQDLPSQYNNSICHAQDSSIRDHLTHLVSFKCGSAINTIFGQDELYVNSYHHQAIKDLAPGLVASAYAPDDVIEAIEDPTRKILAVQWHPEELINAHKIFRQLFEHFIRSMT